MIKIIFKNDEGFRERLHEALVGWDSYVNDDVLIGNSKDNLVLVVGPKSEHNVTIHLEDFEFQHKED